MEKNPVANQLSIGAEISHVQIHKVHSPLELLCQVAHSERL